MMEAVRSSGFTPVPEEVRLIVTGTIEARGRGFVVVLDRMNQPKTIVCVTSGPDDPGGAALADHAGKPVEIRGRWQFEGEGNEVFWIQVASATGTCGAGTQAVYRLYNNGMGAAPNHRYTTMANVRDQMVAAGWVIEGNGPGFAFMCAPV